ncbi:MAG TPA: PAS domain S-box protein [Steroidobacteraceae bacterium]|nr:PAS domain S-box protein [Steroidobacteraceae bacterium]
MNSQAIGQTPLGQASAAAAGPAAGPLDPAFSGLARLAANACGSHLASIAILGGETWCTASANLPMAARPGCDPFAHFCGHVAELFEVPDASLDDRFQESELVAGTFAIRSYAGCALRTRGGETLGTLAVYHKTARFLSQEQRASLLLIAEQVVARAEVQSRLMELALLTDAPGVDAPGAGAPDEHLHPLGQSAGALLHSAPVAVYHADDAGNLIYSNPEYRRMFGLQPGAGPDAWAARVHPDDRARMERVWADFCRQPRPVRFDVYRTQAEDGTVRHFSEQVVAANGVPGWVGTITDLTDLVAARDDWRKAETMFRNTFDQAPIGIVHADRSGKLLRCNPSFWTMLGYDPSDLAQSTVADITHRDDAGRVTEELKRLWKGDIQFVDLEKRYLRKDGSSLWVRMTTALVRASDGRPEYSVEFLRDISARKESAEELERVHKLLMTASRQAGMAEVATNVLHNVGNILNSVNISASLVTERIKQSKAPGVSRLAALLQEKGRALGKFIDNDERGKRIPEYLTSLGEQLMSDQKMALEELASLRDNLEHIKDTVAMQQSYAKLCGVTETVAVVDLVEDSLRLNAGAFVRHGVTLRREFNEVPPITVDKHKVLQILVNLVRNAKYACDESGRSDKLLTLRVEKAPAGVRICVIDNGVGIPAENMPRLFTHGFTTRASGHGFGLHSGALAAQELGGSLRVESDGPGCGATFILELPLSPAEPARA